MSEPIKVGDIVRVTDIDPVEQIDGSHLYVCEPLTHSTLTDIEAASVMLERAHHRIGELTRERNAAQDLADMRQNARAREAEAKLAERDHERDLRKAAERALAEAQAAFLREPSTHEKALKPIGAPRVHRQPNGYDPGARPVASEFAVGEWVRATVDGVPVGIPFQVRAMDIERGWLTHACRCDAPTGSIVDRDVKPEKAADPHAVPFAWVRPGVWAVWNGSVKGASPPIKLAVPVYGGWRGVTPSNVEDIADVLYRRPATHEETVRFEAELLRNTAPPVRLSTSVLGAAIAWAGCLAAAEKSAMSVAFIGKSREWQEAIFDAAHGRALAFRCGDLVDAWDLAEPFQDWLDAGAPEVWPVKPNPTPLAVGES